MMQLLIHTRIMVGHISKFVTAVHGLVVQGSPGICVRMCKRSVSARLRLSPLVRGLTAHSR